MDFNAIWKEARDAAAIAATAENARLGDERSRGLDCGFAWLLIKPARGPFVQWAKAQTRTRTGGRGLGSTRDYSGGGYEIWYSQVHDVPTQSISVHQAAVRAACEVLKKHGIPATTGSRLD